VPQGRRDAASERARARRLARECDCAGRGGRAEQRAAVRGRVRPAQNPRRHRRSGAGRLPGHRTSGRASRRPRVAHRVRREDPRRVARLAPGRIAARRARAGAVAAQGCGRAAPRELNHRTASSSLLPTVPNRVCPPEGGHYRRTGAPRSIDRPGIATVDAAGHTTAVDFGTATLTASAGGQSVLRSLRIVPDLTGIWVGELLVLEETRVSGTGPFRPPPCMTEPLLPC